MAAAMRMATIVTTALNLTFSPKEKEPRLGDLIFPSTVGLIPSLAFHRDGGSFSFSPGEKAGLRAVTKKI